MKTNLRLEKDERYALLQTWLADVLDIDFTISVASADASFRRYFRVQLEYPKHAVTSMIVMDAPPENESLSPFYEIATEWKNNQINTPQVYAKNSELGFMLLEDFGDQTLLKEIHANLSMHKLSLYQKALEQLVTLQSQKQTAATHILPKYSEQLLRRECELFRTWYLKTHCQYELSKAETTYLDILFERLIESALAQTQVPVHRDYHSRNLMFKGQQPLGIIDFQDAVIGPVYYDCVSLLKDCYIKLDSSMREELFLEYHQMLNDKHLSTKSHAESKQQFDLMGIQRHLKAIGIFCRLKHRDNKPGYLLDIPRTASYILDLEQDYPELDVLCRMLKKTLNDKFQT